MGVFLLVEWLARSAGCGMMGAGLLRKRRCEGSENYESSESTAQDRRTQ